METLSVLIGRRIKELREARNMKQVELAELIDMEATNLSKLEKGVHLPKDENLKKITKALNIELQDLFEFGHLKTRENLINEIDKILETAALNEIRFFYKILISYKEMK